MPALCVELTGCTPNFMQNSAITQLQKKLASFRQNKFALRGAWKCSLPLMRPTKRSTDQQMDISGLIWK